MGRWLLALALVATAACASISPSSVAPAGRSPTPLGNASPAAAETPLASSATTPSPPPLASWDASSPTFPIDLGDHTDMYTWDGRFVGRLGSIFPNLSPDGRYYVTQDGQIWSAGGVLTGTDSGWSHSPTVWARDGDYLCTNDENAVFVTFVDGRSTTYQIVNGNNPVSFAGCSINTDRAALLTGPQNGATMLVMSLQTGLFITTLHLNPLMKSVEVSPDVRWMAELLSTGETDILDMADGTIKARFAHAIVDEFFPDGYVVALTDESGPATRVVNWQTGKQLWTAPGHPSDVVASDLSTDRVFVSVFTFSSPSYQYWVVDRDGLSFQIQPKP